MLTAGDGTYRIALPPGRYTLLVTAAGRPAVTRPTAVPVTVESGRYASLDLQVDPGRPVTRA